MAEYKAVLYSSIHLEVVRNWVSDSVYYKELETLSMYDFMRKYYHVYLSNFLQPLPDWTKNVSSTWLGNIGLFVLDHERAQHLGKYIGNDSNVTGISGAGRDITIYHSGNSDCRELLEYIRDAGYKLKGFEIFSM